MNWTLNKVSLDCAVLHLFIQQMPHTSLCGYGSKTYEVPVPIEIPLYVIVSIETFLQERIQKIAVEGMDALPQTL